MSGYVQWIEQQQMRGLQRRVQQRYGGSMGDEQRGRTREEGDLGSARVEGGPETAREFLARARVRTVDEALYWDGDGGLVDVAEASAEDLRAAVHWAHAEIQRLQRSLLGAQTQLIEQLRAPAMFISRQTAEALEAAAEQPGKVVPLEDPPKLDEWDAEGLESGAIPWTIRDGMVIAGAFATRREQRMANEVNRQVSASREQHEQIAYRRGVEDGRSIYEPKTWLGRLFG